MRLFSIMILLLFSYGLQAQELIDLRDLPVKAMEGFDPQILSNSDVELNKSPNWISIERESQVNSSLAVKLIPQFKPESRTIFSLDDSQEETYSFLFQFQLEKELYNDSESFALLLSTVGSQWMVYMNGIMVYDQSQADYDHTRFNEIVPIPKSTVVIGSNLLVFKIQGPKSNYLVGFNNAESYYFGDYHSIAKKQSEASTIVIITIYLLIGLFHLFLFYKLRYGYHNLYFGLFSVSLSLFIFTRTNLVTLYCVDFSKIHRLMSILFYLMPIFGILFFRALFNERLKLFDKILISLNICLAIGCLLFSSSWIYDTIYSYIYLLIVFAFYILIIAISKYFIQDLRQMSTNLNEPLLKFNTIWQTVIKTVSGNVLLGNIIFISILIYDSYDITFKHQGIFVTQYGFLIFVVVIAYTLSNRFINLFNRNQTLNVELEDKINEVEYANQKYRFIVDGTKDLLFILDNNYAVISMNHAGKKFFGTKPELILGKNFIELIYTTQNDKAILTQLINENLNSLDEAGKQTRFKARIKTSRMYEPLELLFHIEAVDTHGHLEFIGKGSRTYEDSIATQILAETQTYLIDNYIILADELSQRLVKQLSKKFPDYKVEAIRTGLREILINSIEHGNLAITFEEKSTYLMQGDYLELIQKRQKDPIYGKRKIIVEYTLNHNQVSYRVTDEGNGFSYIELQKKSEDKELVREHGRGIMLAESIFDKVEYNTMGNSVLLTIFFEETKEKKQT
jgi:PAS domain-containing protein